MSYKPINRLSIIYILLLCFLSLSYITLRIRLIYKKITAFLKIFFRIFSCPCDVGTLYWKWYTRVCLKIAFREMCVPVCGRFVSNEGGVAGYVDRMRGKYTAKWGVQITGMNFQTHSGILSYYCIHLCKGGLL